MSIKRFNLAIIATAMVIAGCSGDKTSQEYYELAQTHQTSGDYNAAVIEYKNAIRQDPKDSKIRLALGKLYLEQELFAEAKKELTRANKDSRLTLDTMMPLATTFFKLNEHQELLDLPLLTVDLPEQDLVIAHVLRGQALLTQGKQEQALAEFTLANELNEHAVYSKLGQAMSASAKTDYDAALKLVKGILDEQPEMLEALSLYAGLLNTKGDFEQAIVVYDQYIVLRGGKVGNVHLLLIDSLISNKNFERAKVELAKLLAINSQHGTVNSLLAKIHYQENNPKLALDYATTALVSSPDDYIANLVAGMSAFRLGDNDLSHRYLSRISKYLTHALGPQVMQIINQIKLGEIENARQGFKKLPPADAKNVKLYEMAANQFSIAQDFKTSLHLLNEIQPFLPDDKNISLKIGVLKVKLNDENGLNDLVAALYEPELVDKVIQPLIKGLVFTKRFDEIARISKKLRETFPKKSHGWDIPAMIALFQKDYDAAETLYLEDLKQFPENNQALLNLAKLRYMKKDFESAMSYIEKILIIQPDNYRAINYKAQLIYKKTEDAEQYKSIFKDAFKLYPESEPLLLKMSTVYINERTPDKSLALLESIKDRKQLSDQYWRHYGDLLMSLGKSEQALAIYHDWSLRQLNSPVPLLKQVLMNEKLRRYKDGLRLIEQIKNKFGKLSNLEGLKVSLMMLDQQMGTARRLFDQLKRTTPDSTYMLGLEGELLFREHKYAKSLTFLSKAYEASPISRYVLLLAKSHVILKDNSQAIVALKGHLKTEPLNLPVKTMLAELLVKQSPSESIAQYQELLEKAPNNPVYLNNLAWILSESGENEAALKHIEHAATIVPENAQLLDTHAVILKRMKRYQEALTKFDLAIALTPDNTEILLNKAELLILMDNIPQAKSLLKKVRLDLKPQFKERYQAVTKMM